VIALDEIEKKMSGHTLVCSLDSLKAGHVRLETAFLYPDGSSVDVFVVEREPLLKSIVLSDLGQTTTWLLDVQVRPWLSKKRQQLVEDALRLYRVEQRGGALEKPLKSVDEIMDGIVHLAQACVRVADLTYTRRSSLVSPVAEEIEEVLVDSELSFEANQELEGRFGKKVRVDFLVSGAHLRSAILALAASNASQAHTLANEIFRRWYDLKIPNRTENLVTVFDDRQNVYREDDLHRLRDVSDVVALSDRQAIRDLLAA
jgi:hypothetical protein